MTINNNKIFFKEITQLISGSVIKKLTKKYNSDYRTQHFDTLSHLYSLIYFQLRGLNSLHDLQIQLANNTKLSRLINVPSVSQFSRKNAKRDFKIFEDIYYYLVGYVYRKYGKSKVYKVAPAIRVIDSTMIDLPFKLAKEYQYDQKQKRSAVKVSTLLSNEVPEKVNIVSGKVNDRKCINGMINNKDSIYIFDRGYYDYKWYDYLTDEGYKFITRQPSNACVEEIKSTYTNNDMVFDYEITLGTEYSKNKTHNIYREILTFTEDGEEIRILTNMFAVPTEDILLLYRRRWQIELFFKWIKQNLRLKHCIGYNENAIKIQIYTALISYLLLFIFRENMGGKSKLSMLGITRIVRSNLLEQSDDVYDWIGIG